jgi:type III restriction enzyme
MSSGIEHLIINSPYQEPQKHWEYNHNRMAFELAEGRRPSGYTVASTTKKLINDPGVPIYLPLVNRIRGRVKEWRENGYAGVSGITKQLLEHWRDAEARQNRFFFCQLEAIETLIWLAEAPESEKVGIDIPGDGGELYRICSKMATGTGKTIVMAMLIAWQSLNKINYPTKKGFSKDFLIVAPNLTVRSRLSVLVPAGEGNYYDVFNIVPLSLYEQLRQAKVVIRNWHALAWDTEEKLRKKRSVDKRGAKSDEAYAREVLGEMATAKNFVVINDEAHHAWRLPADTKGISKDEKEEATIWIGGLDRLNKARGIQTVYDFSATPFIPSGKNSSSENLFGWIVSDFGLTEAIESGLVKTPRVVIRDDGQLSGDYKSKFYHIYNEPEVKTSLNQKDAPESQTLPPLVENAYALLGKDWRETAQIWRNEGHKIPPVMITVANRTETAARIKYAFDHCNILIPELCNAEKTLHIDSKVLEAAEIFAEEGNSETKAPNDDAETEDVPTRKLSKKDLALRLRQTVDTIGREGEIGEQIQHVISVGMLTEGWDAKTVTHIMGLRAFSSQLLCEQVVGRGLRRTSYDDFDENGFFKPEYVNIFGVPFAFMPHESPKDTEVKPTAPKQRIQPLTEKSEYEIRFPNVLRIEQKYKPVLKLDLNKVEPLTLDAYDTRELAELAPVIDGRHDVTRVSEIDLETLYSQVRLQSSVFRATLDIFKQIQPYWKGDLNSLFIQLVPVVEKFIESDKLQISPPMFVDDKRKRVLVRLNAAKIVNHLAPYIQQENVESYELVVDTNKPIISTADMKAWDTSKPFVHTRKSHINFCVCDSRWESTTALHLDRSEYVMAWVKNDHLNFEVRYLFDGGEHKYRPDFLAKLSNDEILVIETKGEEDQKDKVKREAMREWIRAVNEHGGFGRWHSEPAVSKRPDDIPQILERAAAK